MIYRMRAEVNTVLEQLGSCEIINCPAGSVYEALSFSDLKERSYYLVKLLKHKGLWKMYDPPGSGTWIVS